MDKISVISSFLYEILLWNIPLLYGTVGEILVEKSGSLNLGVEGTMAVGSLVGFLVGSFTYSMGIGVLAAFVAGMLCGLLFSLLTVTLKANQNITGLMLTTFGLGLFFFVANGMKNSGSWPGIEASTKVLEGFKDVSIPLLSDIPVIGPSLFNQNALVYLGVAIAVAVWWYLKYTSLGLKLRSIGENPGAADSAGINVNRMKYIHICVGSGIMAIGGFYLALVQNCSFSSSDWIGGYGWIAVALVIFAKWNPLLAVGGTVVFGFFNTLQVKAGSLASAFPGVLGWLRDIPSEFYKALPFIVTAVVLIVTSIRSKKGGGAPAALGLAYFREER